MSNGDVGPQFPGEGQPPDLDQFAKSLAGAISQLGDFTFLKVVPSNFIAESIALVLSIPLKLLGDVIVLAAKTLVDVLETSRAQTDALAAVALSEVFGGDVNVGDLRSGPGSAGAGALGAGVLANLLGPAIAGGEAIAPDAAPAERFMGELLGVGIRGWLLEFITDLIPESFRIAPFNDLVETTLQSLGIGRLARVALQPAIKAAIATPLEWLILDAIRPTLVSEGLAVKAYLRNDWTRQQLEDELGAKGYSSERIDQLIKDNKNFISQADVLTLVRNGVWTEDQAVQDFTDRGFTNGEAQSIVLTDHLVKLDALHARAIAAYELQWKRGIIDDGQFTGALTAIHERDDVAAFWLTVLKAEQNAGLKLLDKTQLDAALSKNVISLPEWRQVLGALGYSSDDVTVLEMTEQATLASKEQASAAKAAAKQQAATDKAARAQAAAAAKQQKADAAKLAAEQKAQDKIAQAQAKQDTLLQKQQLLATQAQARRDQIAKAAAQKLITTAEAQQQLAGVQLAEQQAADAVKANAQIQSSSAAAADQIAAADLTAQTAADQATQAAAAATAQADAQEQALTERRQERIALYDAQRAQVDQEESTGLLTATAAQKKRDTITTNENAAVKAERLDQLAIARAKKSAAKVQAAGAIKAAKASAQAGLIPTATARKQAVIASTAAALGAVKAAGASRSAGAKANIAAAQAGSIAAASQQLDTLNTQLLNELQAFEKAHGVSGVPPPPG